MLHEERDQLLEECEPYIKAEVGKMVRRMNWVSGDYRADEVASDIRYRLLRAIPRWELSKGPLQQFTSPHIRGAIMDWQRAQYLVQGMSHGPGSTEAREAVAVVSIDSVLTHRHGDESDFHFSMRYEDSFERDLIRQSVVKSVRQLVAQTGLTEKQRKIVAIMLEDREFKDAETILGINENSCFHLRRMALRRLRAALLEDKHAA